MKFSSKLKLHTRTTTPPPPPLYELHAPDDAQLAGAFDERQISPREHEYANARGTHVSSKEGGKGNDMTYFDDSDIPEHPPAAYSAVDYSAVRHPSAAYSQNGNSTAGESSARNGPEGYVPAGHSSLSHSMPGSMTSPSMSGQSFAGSSRSSHRMSGHSMGSPSFSGFPIATPSISGHSTAGPSTPGPSMSGHSMAGPPIPEYSVAGPSHAHHATYGHQLAPEHHSRAQPPPSTNSAHVPSGGPPSVRNLEVRPRADTVSERSATVKYNFTPVGTTAMALLPSSSTQNSQPKYFITVALNCFMPSSYVTTVYRGADEHASRVCDFEMGIINMANGRLRMENFSPIALNKLLVKAPRQNARWYWKLPNDTSCFLVWDCSSVPYTCVAELASKAPSSPLARFTSHIQPVSEDYRNPAPELSILEVLPAGRTYFDDILISLLILERIRLTPNPKTLFNY